MSYLSLRTLFQYHKWLDLTDLKPVYPFCRELTSKTDIKSINNMNFFKGSGSSESSSILPTFQEEPACAKICPNLTYEQRIYGFFTCIIIGWIFSLMGSLTLFAGFSAANITVFIILYIAGTVSYFYNFLLY